jgi:hypothetical protein
MKKGQQRIIDTYDDFIEYWKTAKRKNLNEPIMCWQNLYMKKYPELLSKQIQTYENADIDWRKAANKVLHLVPQRLKTMATARSNALKIIEPTYEKAKHRLDFDSDITFVLYVGIGCGAGWATTYNRRPAILLGLENIAEEKWHTENRLEGLISHEIGHLVHMKSRGQWKIFERAEEDPAFLLYSEGFAQKCEHVILQRESWHMAPNNHWIAWCEKNRSWLAKQFLDKINQNNSVRDFFGSWYSINGRKQTGYFLGKTFIDSLEKTWSLKEIALFDSAKVKHLCSKFLKRVSKEDATVCQT